MDIHSLNLIVDTNHDGSYSLGEIWESVKFIYRLPGNLVVEGLGHIPYVSTLLHIHAAPETGYGSFNGLISTALTLIFWVVVVFSVLTLCSPDGDQPEDPAGDAMQNRQYGPGAEMTAGAGAGGGAALESVPAAAHSSRSHAHLPVSRTVYAARGKKPKRRQWRHMVNSFARHAK